MRVAGVTGFKTGLLPVALPRRPGVVHLRIILPRLFRACADTLSPCHPEPSTSLALLTNLPIQSLLASTQADFAHSAIDFLHRVGRTARAGKAGRVTSLYTPEAAPLVDAIRDNIAAGGEDGRHLVTNVAVWQAWEGWMDAWVGGGLWRMSVPPHKPVTHYASPNGTQLLPTAGQPVEGAFSRKRSFRKKFRR